ncbi:hypothetical protein EG68_05174 [Paragonimus skrjabini miyazakii]|uniref:Phospholipid/glycerol acyltransferase domain-containing protein n=1 Tax=Paragonimus skrjabini miyazakii TaxID=59628 RepID=A0A8S9YXE6_9TREM|nr:hypothetical protein EG68_05174 [Paragonimus skrjabini miyazakii]
MTLVAAFSGFYISLIAVYFINSLISAFFKIQFVQHLYIYILERLFSVSVSSIRLTRIQYAASVVTKDSAGTVETSESEGGDNLGNYGKLISYVMSDPLTIDLIERDIELTEDGVVLDKRLTSDEQRGFALHHPLYLVKCGIEAIVEDSVTKHFSAAELRVWNFLGRNETYVYIKNDHWNVLRILWFIGFIFRYAIFFPCKLFTFFVSLWLTWIIGYLGRNCPISTFQKWLLGPGLQKVVRLNLCPFSSVIRFHNLDNRPKPNTICVANHTTPFDWCVLASDVTYAVVGQKHSGFFGLVERIISAAVPAVWFDREEVLDRQLTANRLKLHVACPDAEPLLIFPEGTCINNTSVMKFKKGCFEVGAPIHPVAIKYNPLFADCFWNSSRDSLLKYTFKIMTSWAMVVDVWYLPPTRMRADEDGIEFARRVQQSIAHCGGMMNINWDGELKRRRPKDTLKLAQQRFISQYLIRPDT